MEDKKSKTLRQALGLCVSPTSDMRQNVSQKFTKPSIKTHVYRRVKPIWRPENIVDIYICNLLWLSRRLIISTEQALTFPTALTSNHVVTDICILTNSIVPLYHVLSYL